LVNAGDRLPRQSDSSASDNTANAKNTNLKTIINNKLAALNLSGYNAKMIMNRAEAMSFASNLPIKPLEQVKIAWLMLKIDCRAHQHGQKTYSVAI
jgi:hypothetical protein